MPICLFRNPQGLWIKTHLWELRFCVDTNMVKALCTKKRPFTFILCVKIQLLLRMWFGPIINLLRRISLKVHNKLLASAYLMVSVNRHLRPQARDSLMRKPWSAVTGLKEMLLRSWVSVHQKWGIVGKCTRVRMKATCSTTWEKACDKFNRACAKMIFQCVVGSSMNFWPICIREKIDRTHSRVYLVPNKPNVASAIFIIQYSHVSTYVDSVSRWMPSTYEKELNWVDSRYKPKRIPRGNLAVRLGLVIN